MNPSIDNLLTRVTVKLQDPLSGQTIGTGLIYSPHTVKNQILVLTAAHCLYQDADDFQVPFENVDVFFYNPAKSTYQKLSHKVDISMSISQKNNDVAILVLDAERVEIITGVIPIIQLSNERNDATKFIAKGFPSATNGQELLAISPTWSQHLPVVDKFQLHLGQDFSNEFTAAYQLDGFSGSGVFLVDQGEIFLFGIFTRFIDSGKIISCEYLRKFDKILQSGFLPQFDYSYFGSHGLNPAFFDRHSVKAVNELGPRFNASINLELPIAFYFNSIAKDGIFRLRLAKIVDVFLRASIYGNGSDELRDLDEEYNNLCQHVKQWFESINWSTREKIELDGVYSELKEYNDKAWERQKLLYEKRRNIETDDNTANYTSNEPFSSEISHLNQQVRANDHFSESLSEINVELVNNPVLIISGNAGSGKSHLLGDIVLRRNREGRPALLLLGQLFQNGMTVWQNVLSQLGLSCTEQEFLAALDSIGMQSGTRVIVMIDAINEGAGKNLWRNAVAGFIHDFSDYSNVGLVISLRSTYFNSVLPENVRNDKTLTKLVHQGFIGNEYEAVKLFCEHYGISQPNFPMLNPEYANPLFLHLVCKGIGSSNDKIFPHGFQGISKVFSYYIKAVQDRLSEKRSEYEYRPSIVKNALDIFAHAFFRLEDRRSLTIEAANLLFQEHFNGFPNLLGDLIEESVLIRSLPQDFDENSELEFVYFAYERFGDYFMAAELLAVISADNIITETSKGGSLGILVENGKWQYDGILEAMAVLVPEKYGLEIFEIFGWIFQEERNYHVMDSSISNWFLRSLKWRSIESIDDDKFVKWVETTDQFKIDDDGYFNFLYEMCSVAGHPFNSDRLTRILKHNSMGERDAFIQQFYLYYSGRDDSNSLLPLSHLIDWSWRKDISRLTDGETARLVGQALAWILSSTNIALRDQATKAMVNLLQDQIDALLSIMEAFIDIDDFYILERLFAVMYGCVLRSGSFSDIERCAKYTYEKVFSQGNPPAHLFLRDYARHIIEFALSKKIAFDFETKKIRPPYTSALPVFPTDSEVKKFDREDGKDNWEKRANQASAKISFSVISWDFGRYEVDSAIGHFEPIPFSFLTEIEMFKKELPRGGKSRFSQIEKFFELYDTPKDRRLRFRFDTEEKRDRYWKMVDDLFEKIEQQLIKIITIEQETFLREKIYPFWRSRNPSKMERIAHLSSLPVKNWIVNRVHELGYDGALHSNFDLRENYGGERESKVERIGKKYQWIAFYEILAILSDNFKIRERYSSKKKSWFYRGPWDLTYRDIDPSFTTRREVEKYNDDDDLGIVKSQHHWFMPPEYGHWQNRTKKWSSNTDDLPSVAESILKVDEKGEEWLCLYSSYTWKEPKPVGSDGYRSGRKEVWYLLQCFLVPQQKIEKILVWLEKQNFHGRWLPEPYEISNLFARENYWSPLSLELQKENKLWRTLEDSNHRVMLPVIEGIGSLSEDKSGAHFKYQMPNKLMFESLGLDYGQQDGEFVGKNGEVVLTNVSPLGSMIRRKDFEEFLAAHKLCSVWTLLGEKNSFYGDRDDRDIRKWLSGVYDFKDGKIVGNTRIGDW